LHPSWKPFGESYFKDELPKEKRAFTLGGTRDLDDINVVKWLDALPLRLCTDPIVKIATAP
jgi:hypothetical protein